MIESISLSNTATYTGDPQVLEGLSEFNYFYGSNGTGKTTISRLIAEQSLYPDCSVHWKSDNPLETLVYNQDYIEKNFDQSEHLKGVFTLGEKQKDTLDKIEDLKAEIDYLEDKVAGVKIRLDCDDTEENIGKRTEAAQLEEWLKGKCWAQKQKYDDVFKDAFHGVRNSADKFKTRVKLELSSNQSELKTLEYLQTKAATVFGEEPLIIDKIPEIDFSFYWNMRKSLFLKKLSSEKMMLILPK